MRFAVSPQSSSLVLVELHGGLLPVSKFILVLIMITEAQLDIILPESKGRILSHWQEQAGPKHLEQRRDDGGAEDQGDDRRNTEGGEG